MAQGGIAKRQALSKKAKKVSKAKPSRVQKKGKVVAVGKPKSQAAKKAMDLQRRLTAQINAKNENQMAIKAKSSGKLTLIKPIESSASSIQVKQSSVRAGKKKV